MTNRHNPPVIVGKRDENPIVFFDIAIGDRDVGRIIIELRSDLCPMTCENFRALCTGAPRSPPPRAREVTLLGERGKSKEDKVPLHYKGSKLHRIVNDSHCQGGDIRNGDGTWSGCTFGDNTTFEDENFILRVRRSIVLSLDADRARSTWARACSRCATGASTATGASSSSASPRCDAFRRPMFYRLRARAEEGVGREARRLRVRGDAREPPGPLRHRPGRLAEWQALDRARHQGLRPALPEAIAAPRSDARARRRDGCIPANFKFARRTAICKRVEDKFIYRIRRSSRSQTVSAGKGGCDDPLPRRICL